MVPSPGTVQPQTTQDPSPGLAQNVPLTPGGPDPKLRATGLNETTKPGEKGPNQSKRPPAPSLLHHRGSRGPCHRGKCLL